MNRELRPHQGKALAMLRESISAGRRRPMLQLPTGAGKTVVAAAIVEGARRKGNRVTFVVPALSLVQQTVEAFEDEGISSFDLAVMQADHPRTNPACPIQVASVQTLERRRIPDSDIVVIDEAHRWYALYERWMGDPAWANRPFIGLSATPWTRGLGRHYDDLLIAATTEGLIEDGYLAPFRVFAPSHPDLSEVKTVHGDYHEGELSKAMDQPALVADVVSTWLVRGEDRPTFVFAVDRAHAKHLERQFAASGVAAAYVDADTSPDEREVIRRRFHAGAVRVVSSVGTMTTGVDWDVRCIVLARPTKSISLFTQIIGRGLRTAPGKSDCLVLDHSDSHLRLGFVTDIHVDRLDDGKRHRSGRRAADAPAPKECPSCAFLRPAKVAVCPSCGFKPERQSNVRCEDGDLVEFDMLGERRVNERAEREARQRFYSMLIGYAETRGYKPGWAAMKFKERHKAWPDGLSKIALPPAADVTSWIRSRQIAFAKAKGKETTRAVAS